MSHKKPESLIPIKKITQEELPKYTAMHKKLNEVLVNIHQDKSLLENLFFKYVKDFDRKKVSYKDLKEVFIELSKGFNYNFNKYFDEHYSKYMVGPQKPSVGVDFTSCKEEFNNFLHKKINEVKLIMDNAIPPKLIKPPTPVVVKEKPTEEFKDEVEDEETRRKREEEERLKRKLKGKVEKNDVDALVNERSKYLIKKKLEKYFEDLAKEKGGKPFNFKIPINKFQTVLKNIMKDSNFSMAELNNAKDIFKGDYIEKLEPEKVDELAKKIYFFMSDKVDHYNNKVNEKHGIVVDNEKDKVFPSMPANAKVEEKNDDLNKSTDKDKERLEKEKKEKERLDKERLEKEKKEKERLEKEKKDKERLDKEKKDKERLDKERLDKERLDKEKKDKERLDKEKKDKERLDKEKKDKERLDKEKKEKERLEKEKKEKERLDKEKKEKERLEKEKKDKEKAMNNSNQKTKEEGKKSTTPEKKLETPQAQTPVKESTTPKQNQTPSKDKNAQLTPTNKNVTPQKENAKSVTPQAKTPQSKLNDQANDKNKSQSQIPDPKKSDNSIQDKNTSKNNIKTVKDTSDANQKNKGEDKNVSNTNLKTISDKGIKDASNKNLSNLNLSKPIEDPKDKLQSNTSVIKIPEKKESQIDIKSNNQIDKDQDGSIRRSSIKKNTINSIIDDKRNNIDLNNSKINLGDKSKLDISQNQSIIDKNKHDISRLSINENKPKSDYSNKVMDSQSNQSFQSINDKINISKAHDIEILGNHGLYPNSIPYLKLEALPDILCDYIDDKGKVFAIDTNNEYKKKLNALFDEDIMDLVEKQANYDPEKEKANKLKELLYDKLAIENNIKFFQDLLLKKSHNHENTANIKDAIEKLKKQHELIEHEIKLLQGKAAGNLNKNNNSKKNIKPLKKLTKEEQRIESLREIYNHYARFHYDSKNPHIFDKIKEITNFMDLGEYMKFCSDFKVPLPRKTLIKIFKSHPKVKTISYDEFITALNLMSEEIHKNKIKKLKDRIEILHNRKIDDKKLKKRNILKKYDRIHQLIPEENKETENESKISQEVFNKKKEDKSNLETLDKKLFREKEKKIKKHKNKENKIGQEKSFDLNEEEKNDKYHKNKSNIDKRFSLKNNDDEDFKSREKIFKSSIKGSKKDVSVLRRLSEVPFPKTDVSAIPKKKQESLSDSDSSSEDLENELMKEDFENHEKFNVLYNDKEKKYYFSHSIPPKKLNIPDTSTRKILNSDLKKDKEREELEHILSDENLIQEELNRCLHLVESLKSKVLKDYQDEFYKLLDLDDKALYRRKMSGYYNPDPEWTRSSVNIQVSEEVMKMIKEKKIEKTQHEEKEIMDEKTRESRRKKEEYEKNQKNYIKHIQKNNIVNSYTNLKEKFIIYEKEKPKQISWNELQVLNKDYFVTNRDDDFDPKKFFENEGDFKDEDDEFISKRYNHDFMFLKQKKRTIDGSPTSLKNRFKYSREETEKRTIQFEKELNEKKEKVMNQSQRQLMKDAEKIKNKYATKM